MSQLKESTALADLAGRGLVAALLLFVACALPTPAARAQPSQGSAAIHVDAGSTNLPGVSVFAADPWATEGPGATNDVGRFRIWRDSGTNGSLTVHYALSGTASNGVDYEWLGSSATLPTGSSTVDVVVRPIQDTLAEATETVVLSLRPGIGYRVGTTTNPSATNAAVHIVDGPMATNQPPAVQLNQPSDGAVYVAPANIGLQAYAQDPEDGHGIVVEFFAGTNRLGLGTFVPTLCPAPYCPYFALTWSNVPAGDYVLTARAIDSQGATTTSGPARVTVQTGAPSLAEALDAPGLVWTTGGDAPWFGQTGVTHDGVDAAQSGPVADFEQSWLETQVTLVAPGSVGFQWKVASGVGEFGLAFYTNGVRAGGNIDGDVDWTPRTVPLPAGEHVLRWTFHNAGPGDEGPTVGWVDEVFVTGLAQAPVITAQPESLTRFVGQDATFSVGAVGVPPLRYQWQRNGVDLAAQTNAILALTAVQLSDAGRYRVVIFSPYGTTTSSEGVLTVLQGSGEPGCAGHLDPTFDAGRGQWPPLWPPWAPTPITSVTVQADGKVVIGGDFIEVQGLPSIGIARLDVTGLIDSGYVPNPDDIVSHQRAVQPDGKVLVVLPGDLENPGRLVRYQADGALDPSYTPALPPGFNARAVLLQPDGKALVAGGVYRRDPATYTQTVTAPVARLLADGRIDSSFATNMTLGLLPGESGEASVAVYDIARQDDGRIYLGGFFTAVNGIRRTDVARLHPNGALDSSFEPDITVRPGADSSDVETVSALGLTPDGKLVIAGFLAQIDGLERWAVARLHTTHDCGAPPCVDAPAGLVGWWRAEGNAEDESGGNSGGLVNNVSFVPGKVGQAFAFDGSSYVEVPDAPALRLENELTIEFWVRRERLDRPQAHYIVEKGGDWTRGEQNYAVALHIGAYNHCLHFLFAGGWRGGGSIADTNWHHCAVTARDGAADPALYIDGLPQPIAYREGAGTIHLNPSTRPLHIGAQIDPQSGWFYYHRGGIDELSLYNRALSAQEIEGIYRAGSRGKCASEIPRLFVARHFISSGVQLLTTPSQGTGVYAVEDQPPAGWGVANISHGGVFDAATGKVKFGPFYDGEPRALGYAVLPPPGAEGVFAFSGTASADGVNTPIGGDQHLVLAGWHPAELRETRPADWHMSIEEVTAYGSAWRRGLSWMMPPNPIPIDYVTRAAALWRGGECYTVDSSVTSAPLWWVNCSVPLSGDAQSAQPQGPSLPAALRRLPSVFVPGEPLVIAVSVQPATARAYAVEEQYPAGWTISNLGDGGELDTVNGVVRWGPFLESTPRTLTYQATAPITAMGLASFAGVISFDGSSQAVAGPGASREGCRMEPAWPTQSGQFQWLIRGRPGARLIVEASSDLMVWDMVGEVTLGAGPALFLDPDAAQCRQRFYRARGEN